MQTMYNTYTPYTEKRETHRLPLSEEVYYSGCYYDPDLVPWWSQKIPTACLNESPRGMCILTHRHLPKGTRLCITAPHWDAQREGTVRWCRSIGVGRYKAGLTLTY